MVDFVRSLIMIPYFIFSHKNDSTIADVHLSVCLSVCLYVHPSVTKPPQPLRIMPICHYLHLPFISHHAYCISAIIPISPSPPPAFQNQNHYKATLEFLETLSLSLCPSLPNNKHAYQLSDLLSQLLSL